MNEDPRVLRGNFSVGALLTVLFLVIGSGYATASPAGPRLAVTTLRAGGGTELFTADSTGGSKSTVYAAGAERIPGVFPFYGPSWSPDGLKLAFTALTGERQSRYGSFPRTMIALVGAGSGPPEPVPGTSEGAAPIFSPDGQQIAFTKERFRRRSNGKGGAYRVYESASMWLVDLGGGAPRQLTPWRNGLHQAPSSFSPDGTRLAFTRMAGDAAPQAMEMLLTGARVTVLVDNALDPVYSPDGTRLAFLRGPIKSEVRRRKTRNGSTVSVAYARLTDLYLRHSDGGLQRLTKTTRRMEFGAAWDPSGQRLVYTTIAPFGSWQGLLGFGDSLMQINADGTCTARLFSESDSAFYGAAWQPGPGREAGPIPCASG